MQILSFDQVVNWLINLGGLANNICQKETFSGQGIFPVNELQPSIIYIPEKLQIQVKDLYFQDGKIFINQRERYQENYALFFESYLNDFELKSQAFIQIIEFENELRSLPRYVIDNLSQTKIMNIDNRNPAGTEDFFLKRFIDTRQVKGLNNQYVLAPIFILVNHDSNARSFVNNNGLTTIRDSQDQGQFLHKYTDGSPISFFYNYGFASPESFAFSVPISIINSTLIDKVIRINCKDAVFDNEYSILETATEYIFPSLQIANRINPRLPFLKFSRVLTKFNENALKEIFCLIVDYNQKIYIEAIDLLDKVHSRTGLELRKALIYELKLILKYNIF
tara:strand:- start:691 stop:1698 length:1008 start_codon:yes stop_codon:yes gene_type:complete